VVVGHGMMARAFSAFAGDAGVLIYASGVSDSGETRPDAFRRESGLLQRTRADHPDALLVYFGTCSVDDPDRRDTPYVRHKLEMESQIRSSPGPWMVLRLPLAVGPGRRGKTLANFLYDRIIHGRAFDVWAHSTRYPIDVEDAYRIASRLIEDRSMWRRTVNVALRAYKVLDFVRILEEITGRKAAYALVEKGRHFELHCPEVAALAGELHLDFSEGYLEKVLRKYFTHGAA
jgi:nucleoside-diphosphate-sugar epimerase